MGRLHKAWQLVEKILGKQAADRLRALKPVDIAATNGYTYRIDPTSEKLQNLTLKQQYCVHPAEILPFPDLVVIWYDYITHRPDILEKTVGPMSAHHRTRFEDLSIPDNYVHEHTLAEIRRRERLANREIQEYFDAHLVSVQDILGEFTKMASPLMQELRNRGLLTIQM